jgi:hypothetical protein
MADYQQIVDPRLLRRVAERYQAETDELQRMGFRYLGDCLEIMGPYSAVYLFLVVLLAHRKREVLTVPPPLRLAVGNRLLAHADPPCVALTMGMGTKLYTGFDDGTLLLSSDFASMAKPRPESPILRLAPAPTLAKAWQAHLRQAELLAAGSKRWITEMTFEMYVRWSTVEEDLSQYY